MGWIAGALFMLALSAMNADLDAKDAAMKAEPVGRGVWCYSCVEREMAGVRPERDGWVEEEQ